ncbi:MULTISPECIES: CysB family HTH-type transcriptional regulator [Uliginosibacterium]|uniref:CysB family HTH-type transcriptional regulator n=1 Tax=Uliginosibacterium aquaticum TaxID=2731212 RepID=A0ABX2IEL9_9RHOO|nr:MULTISPECIES: CysB family HTH-type transcriptional regulator [Uliginosibacterium]MDO6385188.1 CysB family HTH-type transcriptional regulator [Uliginosibacterium sp. 31-12]NSL55094.1 CysB family HTH-type transcriptional regulator [Uliginosibacterium aquaticum]PLK48858.1 transcriptional regulator [Uliginosibacterium sp. TH139]
MNFQQLRIVRETVRQNYNLTEVANALFTSQPGVSKHIKDLEDELGVELFIRRGKRLLGLTEPGKELVVIVERMLLDARNIKKLADQFTQRDQGQLTVVTTHTQARYAIPKVVTTFKQEYPKVHLALHQGSPQEIVQQLLSGEADIGIATESLDNEPELVTFPFYDWHHAVLVPAGHPLLAETTLSLEALAEYPLITYHSGFTGRSKIDKAFAAANLTPDIVMSALDADVIKSYVELGLGVGIIAPSAFNPLKDHDLRLIDASHLFARNTTLIAVRRGHYLRGYAYRFIELCSPELTETNVRAAVAPHRENAF